MVLKKSVHDVRFHPCPVSGRSYRWTEKSVKWQRRSPSKPPRSLDQRTPKPSASTISSNEQFSWQMKNSTSSEPWQRPATRTTASRNATAKSTRIAPDWRNPKSKLWWKWPTQKRKTTTSKRAEFEAIWMYLRINWLLYLKFSCFDNFEMLQ